MATLWIREFKKIGGGAARLAPVAQEPAAAGQDFDFTTTAGASAAFSASTVIVRLISDADCFLAFGDDPTADEDTGFLLKADIAEYVGVYPGHKVSAVQPAA